eukprot:6576641-Prymnesium_polylepis.1
MSLGCGYPVMLMRSHRSRAWCGSSHQHDGHPVEATRPPGQSRCRSQNGFDGLEGVGRAQRVDSDALG